MTSWKQLLDQARTVAKEHLPTEVVGAARKLKTTVVDFAPAPIADAVNQLLADDEDENPPEAGTADAPTGDAASQTSTETTTSASEPEYKKEDPQEVLARVKRKADSGLKPEDRLVVIYATPDLADEVAEIRGLLAEVETTIREFDLAKEPQTAKQLAKLTDVMVPPYVFINGRYWGGQYELATLAAAGDLENAVANRIDELGAEARRIGKIHDSYSDEISVENILKRWKLGHILCVDDIDSWFETDKEGVPHFYYQGGPRDVDHMNDVAQEIVDKVTAEEIEANWQLDPTVHL